MRTARSLVFVLSFLSTAASAETKVTLVIESSYPSEVKIIDRDNPYRRPATIWRHAVPGDTVITASISPKKVTSYVIQDANSIINEWTDLEDGDSVVFTLDLDSGHSRMVHDRDGYVARYERASADHWKFRQRVDSIWKLLRYPVMRHYTKELRQEYITASKPVLDSLRGSGYYEIVKSWGDHFYPMIVLSKLRQPWGPDTKEHICSKPLNYRDFVPAAPERDEDIRRVIDHWLQIIFRLNSECGPQVNGDSLQRAFIGTLSGRERAIAFLSYAKSRLSYRNGEEEIRLLDSMVRVHVKDADLVADYDAMIADIRSLAEGSFAPDIELPDQNGVIRRLSDLRGKPVLIDFWGTWCPPCLDELPFVDTLAKDYAHTDLQILSIALEYKQVAYWKKFIHDRQLPGLHLYAEAQFNNEQAQKFRVDATGVPSYYLIDRDGRIVMANALRPSNPKLREVIDRTLRSN